jgi:hypothetical protein
MSTTSRRLVAAVVAATIAVLTGIAVGRVSPRTTGRAAAARAACPVDRFEAVPAVVGVAGGLAAGMAAFALLLGAERRPEHRAERRAERRAKRRAEHRAEHRPERRAGHRGGAPTAEADRAALIQACIYVRDRTTSRALADRLGTALRDAGVRTVEPAGARFDPAQHEAGGAAPSGDPAKIGTIAAVEAPGYADRDGRLLRVPVVTVFQAATIDQREDR